ncbi:apurinic/apyrimidinic endonuclease Apn1 [Plasmodium gonderi]|uniref:Apurinic/apyrimidinic endonuclease Apn1 n=1 Tax=Plasmodium gonderi TaxID=77519 RepID=A0A1Y1JN29_PLAGO|nr:apurinic/apyrimidinic endonuclease Apn1 [Plasmodium gonderi]GAW82242.1 apurinic/apyrimidinic endonuclease Apn1 [Plasmodium gonderi]
MLLTNTRKGNRGICMLRNKQNKNHLSSTFNFITHLERNRDLKKYPIHVLKLAGGRLEQKKGTNKRGHFHLNVQKKKRTHVLVLLLHMMCVQKSNMSGKEENGSTYGLDGDSTIGQDGKAKCQKNGYDIPLKSEPREEIKSQVIKRENTTKEGTFVKNKAICKKGKKGSNQKVKTKKKETKKEPGKAGHSVVTYPPIPQSMDELWNDFERIKVYAKTTNVYLGAHISAAGGVQNAPINSFKVAGQAFALFLKNQRKWDSPGLSSDNIKQFEENCKKYNLDTKYILPHGSYLINLANPDKEKREKSYSSFLDDVKRCEQLKIKLYNFHPGSTTGLCSLEEGIKNVADCINRVHKETSDVVIVLENSAGQKNSVGSKFEDLKKIILQIEDKERIGVCLDTCHTFAAGYNIKSYADFDNVMKKFDEIVDASYLKAVHLNDSKSDIGSGLDRHENIGKGKLTLDTFRYIMTSNYFKKIPIILETPDVTNDESVYKYEIRYLYELGLKQDSLAHAGGLETK